MRRALLRLLLWSVAGGLPPRRPDQVIPAGGAGVAPGASSGITRARLVIISGPSSGMFLYSGIPGHGDLVESVTEAVSDPFLNTTQPGFASYDNVFGGVAQLHGALLKLFGGGNLLAQLGPGGLSIFNSHGALIFSVDTARDAWFLYADTGSAVQGALQLSSASVAGTDSFSNGYPKGLTNFSAASPATVNTNLNGAVLTFTDTVNAAFSGGFEGLASSGVVGTNDSLALLSPLLNSTDVEAGLFLIRALTGGTALAQITNAALNIKTGTSPPQPANGITVSANAGGFGRLRPSASGDTTSYSVGLAVTPNTGAVALVQTSFTNIFGGLGVAAGNYLAQAHLIVTIGGTGTALVFQLTGPAVGANTSVKWWLTVEAGTGQQVFAGHSLGSLGAVTLPSGTTVGAGGVCHIWMSAYLQFSASGTLNLQGETSVALSGATVAIGSTLELSPA